MNILEDLKSLIYESEFLGIDISSFVNIGPDLKFRIKEFIDVIGINKAEEIYDKMKIGYSGDLLMEFKTLMKDPEIATTLENLRQSIFNDPIASKFVDNNFVHHDKNQFKYFNIFNNIGKIGIGAIAIFISIIYIIRNKKQPR